MARVVMYVKIEKGKMCYYEVMVNKLVEFQHVFKDSFMEWQIWEMSCKPSTYNLHFEKKKYLEFFKDFLIRHDDFDRNEIVDSVHVCSESLPFHDRWITVGGDEQWE